MYKLIKNHIVPIASFVILVCGLIALSTTYVMLKPEISEPLLYVTIYSAVAFMLTGLPLALMLFFDLPIIQLFRIKINTFFAPLVNWIKNSTNYIIALLKLLFSIILTLIIIAILIYGIVIFPLQAIAILLALILIAIIFN